MILILTFLANAGLSLLLGLAVAHVLGPDAFGRYGVAMALAVVVNAVGFEWLRLSATRHYSERSRHEDPGLRASLDAGYAFVSLSVLVLALVAYVSGADLGLAAPLLLATAAAGLGMGIFDYQAALARARFLEATYARLVLLKNAAAFLLMVGGAYVFASPAVVMAGAASSTLLAALAVRRRLRDVDATPGRADLRRLASFSAYAGPLVGASVAYQLMPLVNRGVLAWQEGYGEAGQFALAADLGLRLFMTVGSALDVLLFQLAVRTEEQHGRAEAERQVARNMALLIALMLPLAAGLWLTLPALNALVVPGAYRLAFESYMTALIPGFVAFAIIQYALHPLFQLRRTTAPALMAAAAALAVDAALALLLPRLLGGIGVAFAQSAGLVAGAGILAALALRAGLALPWRAIGLGAAATGMMSVVVLPVRDLDPPALALTAAVTLGALAYGAAAWLTDLACLRSLLKARLGHARIAAPAR